MQNQRIIIIFPDDWLSYSPTIINLANIASHIASVHIITVDESKFQPNTFHSNDNIRLHFINLMGDSYVFKVIKLLESCFIRLFDVFFDLGFFGSIKLREIIVPRTFEKFLRLLKLRKAIKEISTKDDIMIGIDNIGILSVTSLNRSVHALSLEIGKNVFYYFIDWKYVASIVTQTFERREYWLPTQLKNIATFYVQNSPIFNAFKSPKVKNNNFKIIYLGFLSLDYNAIDTIVQSLYLLPSQYSLTLKGPKNKFTEDILISKYGNLYKDKRLSFDYSYVSNDHLLSYLNQFSIGITLYDIATLPYYNFNVISCPSGKLFNYYHAAIPVIGNDILGLKSALDFNAGILLDELTAESIANAILKISCNYNWYSYNSKCAAKYFDFNTNISPFLQFILNNSRVD